jgi:hypothetical protein
LLIIRIGTITVLMVVVLIAVKACYRPHLGRICEHVPAAVRAAAADQDGPIETPPLPEIGPGREIEPGKSVTLVVVPSGGHYDSMIREGIPRGIAWLLELAGPPRAVTADKAKSSRAKSSP